MQKKEIIVYRNKKIKFYLSLIVVLLVIISFYLFLRAFIVSNPPTIEFDEPLSLIRNNNPSSVLGSLNNNLKENAFGLNISSDFSPTTNHSKIFFLLEQSDLNTILSFDGTEFTNEYQTLNDIQDILLFEDNSFALIEDNKRNFVIKTVENRKTNEIYKFDYGQVPVNLYFDSKLKIFYTSFFDKDNAYNIYSFISQNVKSQVYFSRETLSFNIMLVDNVSQKIFLRNENQCLSVEVSTQKVEQIKCEFIKTEQSNKKPIVGVTKFGYVDYINKKEIVFKEGFDSTLVKGAFIEDNILYNISLDKNNLSIMNLNSIDIKSENTKILFEDVAAREMKKFFKFKDKFYILTTNTLQVLKEEIPLSEETIISPDEIYKTQHKFKPITIPYFDIVKIELLNSVNF